MTRRGIADHTRPNISIMRRAWPRSDCVSMTTPPPRLMRPEFASQTRFFSLRTAKQLSLTCFMSMASIPALQPFRSLDERVPPVDERDREVVHAQVLRIEVLDGGLVADGE